MLDSRDTLTRIRADPPPTPQDADLGFKLIQSIALVEIAEALTNIADLLLEARNKEEGR